MKVILKTEVGKSITLNINPEDTFRDIKERMVSDDGVPLDLFVNGMEVTDDQNVLDFFSGQQGLLSQSDDEADAVEDEEVVSPLEVCCSVPGCINTKAIHPNKAFFRFPIKEDRRHQWLLVCQREDLMSEPSELFKSSHAICADHFSAEQFQSAKELKVDAIPTEFPYIVETGLEEPISKTSALLGECGLIIKTERVSHAGEEETEDVVYYNDGEEMESDSESIDDVSGRLCRLCASSSDEMVYIYSPTGVELGLAHMINSSMPITVKKSDKLPKQLCMSCLSRLNTAYELAEECIRAKEQLNTLMKMKYFRTNSSLQDIASLETVHLNKRRKVQHMNEDAESVPAEHGGGVCCPMCKEEDLVKVDLNSAELDDVSYDSSDEISFSDEEVTEKDSMSDLEATLAGSKTSAARKVKKDPAPEIANKYVVVENGSAWSSNNTNDVVLETIAEGAVLGGKTDKNVPIDYLYQDSVLVTCKICDKVFTNIDECLEHSKVHAEDHLYPCSLCDLCYTNEEDINTHFEEHKVEEEKRGSPSRLLFCACGRRFNSEKSLREHACVTRERKQFKCNVCSKSFWTSDRLVFHQKFHEGAQLNYCELCFKHFDNEGTLYYHNRMVHEHERRFPCEDCGKRFHSKARLVAHSHIHTGDRPYECDICSSRFFSRDTLKGHYVTHMTTKPFQCEVCGVYCARKTILKQHMASHHLGTHPKRVPSLIHYYCKVCVQTYTSSQDVVNHRLSHMKESEGFCCEYCGVNCQNVKSLSLHQKRDHQDERPYICSLCKNQSRTLYEARIHRKVHMSDTFDNKDDLRAIDEFGNAKMCMCEKCGKIFEDRKSLLMHVKSCHVKELFYECEFCEKKFADNQRLTVHRRLHTGEKPYECQVCNKRFAQTSALYTHNLLHSGIKPHSCDLCGKAFRIKADRDNHRRTHTGEKPFKCEYCAKAFRTGQVYYQHRMIHTGERRFPCDVCGLAFKRSHTLVVHKRIHTGEKPNICDFCGKGFRQRTDMRKHRALHGLGPPPQATT